MEEQETEQTLQGEQQTELRKGEKDRRLPLSLEEWQQELLYVCWLEPGFLREKAFMD